MTHYWQCGIARKRILGEYFSEIAGIFSAFGLRIGQKSQDKTTEGATKGHGPGHPVVRKVAVNATGKVSQ